MELYLLNKFTFHFSSFSEFLQKPAWEYFDSVTWMFCSKKAEDTAELFSQTWSGFVAAAGAA